MSTTDTIKPVYKAESEFDALPQDDQWRTIYVRDMSMIAKYLGVDLSGLKFAPSDIAHRLCIIAISLRTEIERLRKVNKSLTSANDRHSQLDIECQHCRAR